jgi:peptide/nickel transport system substrate-binding protein
VASKANKWQGRNITRWRNPEYDKTWAASDVELDPVKRAALLIKCNDLVINDVAVIPVIYRLSVGAAVNGLQALMSGWDNDTWNLADWYKEA